MNAIPSRHARRPTAFWSVFGGIGLLVVMGVLGAIGVREMVEAFQSLSAVQKERKLDEYYSQGPGGIGGLSTIHIREARRQSIDKQSRNLIIVGALRLLTALALGVYVIAMRYRWESRQARFEPEGRTPKLKPGAMLRQ